MTRNGWKRDAPLPRQGRLGGLPRRLADGMAVISAQKWTPKYPVLGRPQQGRPLHSRRQRRRFGPGRPDSLPSRAGDRQYDPPARDGARHAVVQSIPACGFAGRVPRACQGSGRGLGSVPVILLDTHIFVRWGPPRRAPSGTAHSVPRTAEAGYSPRERDFVLGSREPRGAWSPNESLLTQGAKTFVSP